MYLREPRRALGYACLLVVLATFIPSASAQGIGGSRGGDFGNLSGFDLNPLQRMTQFSRVNEIVPMEGAVDAEAYLVGPGDLFDVSVGGPQPVLLTLPVSADGHLLLPEAGAVDVAGRSLVEARQIARAALRSEYENVRVEVTLSQPRQFYVHVSGAVPTPGRYVATPVARVATVLNMAYVDTTRAPVGNPDLRPALRNIKLIHRDGSSDRVDLLRYYSTGNTDHNPYLRDGDVISVPTYDPNYEAVFLGGDLPYPGTYDYRPDDTLYDLLVLGTGENPPMGFTQARLLRADGESGALSEVYDLGTLDRSIKIRPRDQVNAVRDPVVRGTATIEGWVEYPGTYPISPGETTLESIVDMAGGLRSGALARGAYLQRATLPMPALETNRRNPFELTRPELTLVRPDSMAILHNTRLAEMDFLSRAYLALELQLQSRVPVDLSGLGTNPAIRLQDEDRVFVPRDENSVFVLGQVNRPGYVAYDAGASFLDYIDASGGFTENAGQAFLIEAGTGRYLDARTAAIQSGDKIFVDRDQMRADTWELQRLLLEDRRADLDERSRTVQNIVSSISAATAIVTTYLLIRREFN